MPTIEPIGFIRSPYKEKFAVPRQPNLAPSVQASINLVGQANNIHTVRGLERFSHIWLLFLFDKNNQSQWSPTVRPPRLGGNQRIGVFASRSTFRPNSIGMSAVGLKSISCKHNQVTLHISSADLVDNTPIIDIKPYIPYSDALPNALGGYAQHKPSTLNVYFSNQVLDALLSRPNGQYERKVIEEVLRQDPRPAYRLSKEDSKSYAVKLFDLNVHFSVAQNVVHVECIETF